MRPVITTIARIKVLFLCTGNICRSPMAEALLRHALEARGAHALVLSAGITFDDQPASEGSVRAMAKRDIDISGHRSRIMWPELLQSADLVIAMARAHVREAAVMAPEILPRTFTLKEFVRRGRLVGPRGDEPLESWLERMSEGRDPASMLGHSDADDVADPIGRPMKVYEATAVELETLIDRMADLLWGSSVSLEIGI